MLEKNRYNDLDRLVRRSVARARREFIESQIAERNWKGVKMCKPYQAKPHRIVDLAKKERPLHERAEVIAEYYAAKQWNTVQLPPMPNRPPIFPVADLPRGNFSAQELRKARNRLKKKKSPGTDGISNEILLFVMECEVGFAYILDLMNMCWVHRILPAKWQIARIVAIYKNKGCTKLPENYRPIALLQSLYKVFTTLIERRLRGMENKIWKMQSGYRSNHSTDDAIVYVD